jgi:hypothetical protein
VRGTVWAASVSIAFIVGCLVFGSQSPSQGAPVKTADPVEVVNFPLTQMITGTVNVGNFPTVQEVEIGSGTVTVSNLPLDENGNLRVAGQVSPNAATLELRFHESDRNPFGRFGPFHIPAGFSKVMISAASLDSTRTGFRSATVWFSSSTAPLQHTALGDFIIYRDAGTIPNEGSTIGPFVNGDQISLNIDACAMMPSGCLSYPSSDSEYYVHLYFTK